MKLTTWAEHCDYRNEIVRLKLVHCNLSLFALLRKALRERVDVYRKTIFNPGLLNPMAG